MGTQQPLLDVRDLRLSFRMGDEWVPTLSGVSFALYPGETLGVVGESGCGKSVSMLACMRLLPQRVSRLEAGQVFFEGRDLLQLREAEMQSIRGNRIGMIFQEPMTALNPIYPVGFQIGEVLRRHQGIPWRAVRARVIELLRLVGIPDPAQRINNFPHQMSGGMRQRVMIAMALACGPSVLIADEPTTALDVTIQAQILELLQDLQKQAGMSVVFVTHNLAVVAEVTQRVVVMYAGHVIEESPSRGLFDRPLHPYTAGLLTAIPRLDIPRDRKLNIIPGSVPAPELMPAGCRFSPRCPYATAQCQSQEPPDVVVDPSRRVRCWLYSDQSDPDWRENSLAAMLGQFAREGASTWQHN